MTRSTEVIVTSPGIDPQQMWRVMATILRAPEQYDFTVNADSIRARLGQGLDALMDLEFKADASLRSDGEHEKDWCDGGDACWCDPAHYIKADFDTAYGATDSCGCHSGGIHIRLVSQLGAWLDEQGATWAWRDESGDGWQHDDTWGTLGDPREACPLHRAIAPPRSNFAPA